MKKRSNKSVAEQMERLKPLIIKDFANGMNYLQTARKHGISDCTLAKYCINWKIKAAPYRMPFKTQVQQEQYIIKDVEKDLLTRIFPPDYRHGVSKCMSFNKNDLKDKRVKDYYEL